MVPGTKRLYSNFGGGLIGSLIEKLSGQSLDDYMRENVFEPLNVTAAYQASLLPENASMADIYHMPKKIPGKRLRADSTRNGVVMLRHEIMSICYNRLINPAHEVENPFAVE